jgi:hypothetical protein
MLKGAKSEKKEFSLRTWSKNSTSEIVQPRASAVKYPNFFHHRDDEYAEIRVSLDQELITPLVARRDET